MQNYKIKPKLYNFAYKTIKYLTLLYDLRYNIPLYIPYVWGVNVSAFSYLCGETD